MGKKDKKVVIRCSEDQLQDLQALANLNQASVSEVVREMIEFGLKNTHKPKASRLEKSHLQASFETLLLMRKVAERIDETLLTKASAETKTLLQRYFGSIDEDAV